MLLRAYHIYFILMDCSRSVMSATTPQVDITRKTRKKRKTINNPHVHGALPTTNISATMIVMIIYRMIEVGIMAGMKTWNPGW
jgi:hypothetical protein